MQLVVRRSQRAAGLMGGKVKFGLNAQILITEEERGLIRKYGLGSSQVYNSEQARKHAAAAATSLATGSVWGAAKGALSAGRMALSLRCTIDSLTKGQFIECAEMEELLAAEEAIVEACQTTKAFLEAAATFDGRELLMDI